MRHYAQLDASERRTLFLRPPSDFGLDSDVRTLGVALGATLYCPATRPRLCADVRKQAARGVASMVFCLEDSISDAEVPGAEQNLVRQLSRLHREASEHAAAPGADPAGPDALPLLFVRVRTPRQIRTLTEHLGPAVRLLAGYVLPKFTATTGQEFLEELLAAEDSCGRRLLAMPVLESPELMHLETRAGALADAALLLEKYRERIPALRIGVTDFCSVYGLRRTPDMTVYDMQPIAAVIADVVNVFGRADGTGYTISGAVWEYFRTQPRMFKPQLRNSPFRGRGDLRERLIEHDMDGLLQEIELDRANGLQGKTCIHPSHVAAVHALSVVTHEEYCDALDIVNAGPDGGGVLRSTYTNKMNEVKPHRSWAARTLQRAEVFGVAREGVDFVDLLVAASGEESSDD